MAERKAANAMVVTYASALDAWTAIAEDRQPYDLLLVDVRFPSGQPHGLALAMHSQRQHPTVPIIVVSGYPEFLASAQENGHRVFTKRFDVQQLREAVKAELQRA